MIIKLKVEGNRPWATVSKDGVLAAKAVRRWVNDKFRNIIMTRSKRSKSQKPPSLIVPNQVSVDKGAERIDRTPVIIETTSDKLFLKPIIIIEDGVAKQTKYCLRKTRKGALRLE